MSRKSTYAGLMAGVAIFALSTTSALADTKKEKELEARIEALEKAFGSLNGQLQTSQAENAQLRAAVAHAHLCPSATTGRSRCTPRLSGGRAGECRRAGWRRLGRGPGGWRSAPRRRRPAGSDDDQSSRTVSSQERMVHMASWERMPSNGGIYTRPSRVAPWRMRCRKISSPSWPVGR